MAGSEPAEEVDGHEMSAVGYSQSFPDDQENLARQFDVYDALYAWCRLQVARGT